MPDTLALPTSSTASPWALVTVASIGKRIGVLQERLSPESPAAKELALIEETFQDVLFDGLPEHSTSLTQLAIRLDAVGR